MVLLCLLLAIAVLTFSVTVAYDVAEVRALRRRAREEGTRAAVRASEAILIRHTGYAADNPELLHGDTRFRPMDAWIDDAIWRRLDEL